MSSALVALLIMLSGITAIEIGFSAAVLEIMSGVLAVGFFGVERFPWIDFLGNFGLLAIMFLAGFEVRLDSIKGKAKKIVAMSLASFFVPFVAVFLTAHLFLQYDLIVSLLVATALSTTSIALVFPFLKQKGVLKRKTGSLLIATAAMVDLISMIALAVVLSSPDYALLLLVPFAFIGWKGFPKIGKFLFSRYKGDIAEVELRFILFILLGIAFFAESVNVHAAIIVFFVGVMFSEIMQDYAELETKLRGITFGFLAPVFFFRAGMLIDVNQFTLLTFGLTGLLFAVSMVSKYYGTYFAAKRFLHEKYARLMAASFSYKLSFSLIVAVFGLESGLIGHEVYNAILATVVLSAVVPSLLVRQGRSELASG